MTGTPEPRPAGTPEPRPAGTPEPRPARIVRLTVVTVLYRSREVLSKTLPTWATSARGQEVEFVFVDHAPDDGCADVVADCLDAHRYRYLPDPTNPGFAAGCNRAVRNAAAPHVLLLNPDVWLREDSLPAILTATARTPDRPIAIGLFMRGRAYTGIDLSVIGLFNDRRSGRRRAPLGPSGGAAVFPAALFRRYDGFDEHLFAWGEDADLAFRLYAAGVRTETLDLALPHAWGHSVGSDRGLGELRSFLLARNRALVAARNLSWPLLLLALPVMAVAHCALAARRAGQGLLLPFLKGVGRGVLTARAARRQWRGDRFGIASLVGYARGGGSQ
jgi:GT2 family glycosyltransferase